MSRVLSISSLMSPPESKPLESFSPRSEFAKSPPAINESHQTPERNRSHLSASRTPEQKALKVLPSPPVSPWPNDHRKDGGDNGTIGRAMGVTALRDPVLYPPSEVGTEILADELFPDLVTAESIVDKHMACHMSSFDKKVNRPTREEYLLALSCVSNIGQSYNRNPGAYMKRTRDETDEQYWKAKRICAAPGVNSSRMLKIAPATPPKQPKRQLKAVPQPKSVTRVRRTPKQSPRERLLEYNVDGTLVTPEPRPTPTKRPEDIDYNSLPDYCPPTSTLPPGNKSLKADWGSNNPLNLSNDPDRHLLHEAEVTLASTLRLNCATYLCSKRRIFEARLGALKIGKEFRKTDAQQACKIDVNKASKLWTAYDKVGWFNRAFYQQYL